MFTVIKNFLRLNDDAQVVASTRDSDIANVINHMKSPDYRQAKKVLKDCDNNLFEAIEYVEKQNEIDEYFQKRGKSK